MKPGRQSARKRVHLSIRTKIVALIGATLTMALGSYLILGSSLIERDKVSYVYDYALAEVSSVARGLEVQVQTTESTARIFARLAADGLAAGAYEKHFDSVRVPAVIVLRPSGETTFETVLAAGPEAPDLQTWLQELGWTPQTFAQDDLLIGADRSGRFPLGGRSFDAKGNPIAYVALLRLDTRTATEGKGFDLRIADATGKAITGAALPSGFFESLPPTLASGVRDLRLDGQDMIVGYQRTQGGKFLVAGLVTKSSAFEAARMLIERSMVLGISVLFLAIAATILFARTLTGRLSRLWGLTKKIAEGDFSGRVEFTGAVSDEITDLAFSFNAMSQRINELINSTAEKARLQSELETAQLVQKRFFPQAMLNSPQLRVAGDYIPATECGGDWWSYSVSGNHAVVVIGDVIGHGASAALITALAHGGFSAYMDGVRTRGAAPDPLNLLLQLNRAVFGASQGQVTMTFLAMVFDLKHGTLKMSNAAHCTPYLYRPKPGYTGNPVKLFQPLMGAKGASLGHSNELEIDSAELHLQPGDSLFLFTDGLIECENEKGEAWNKTKLLKMLHELYVAEAAAGGDPAVINTKVMNHFLDFLGEARDRRADDTTSVTVCVPANVRFDRKDQNDASAAPVAQPPRAA